MYVNRSLSYCKLAAEQTMVMIQSTFIAVTLFLVASTSVSAFVAPGNAITYRQSSLRSNNGISSSKTQSKMSAEGTLDVSSYMTGPTPEGTEDFIMQQTMVRVKDPKKSLDFYCNVLGFKLIMYSEVSFYTI